MPSRVSIVVTAMAVLCCATGHSAAQPTDRASTASSEAVLASSGSSSGNHRSKANDWMFMPSGTSTLGGALQFMTGDDGLGSEEIQFTDLIIGLTRRFRPTPNRAPSMYMAE